MIAFPYIDDGSIGVSFYRFHFITLSDYSHSQNLPIDVVNTE